VNIPTPAASYLAAVIKTLDPATLHGAHGVLVHSLTGFGKEVADGALRAAADIGLTVCPVPFDPAAPMPRPDAQGTKQPMSCSPSAALMTNWR
jgi:hypothetical protein